MTDEQREEYNDSLRLFAGISLPGVIATQGGTSFPEKVAKEAFNIAEAMLVEYNKRKDVSDSSDNS